MWNWWFRGFAHCALHLVYFSSTCEHENFLSIVPLVNRRKIEILKQIEVYDLDFLVILNMAMKMDQMVQMNMWNF